MRLKINPKTGRPIRFRRKLSKAAKELKVKATLALREEMESGRQGKRSIPDMCREFGLSPTAITSQMRREDWSTPNRIAKRKTNIVAEAQRNGGVIYRPNGCTKTDSMALEELREESMQIRVKIEAEPAKPEVEKSKVPGGPKISKSLSFSQEDSKSGKREVGSGDPGRDTSKNFPDKPTKLSAATPSNTTTSARSPEKEDDFDEKVATLAERSLTKFYESGGLIPIHKVGDLKAVDELYRRATRQKSATSARQSVIQIGVLSGISHESVNKGTSVIAQVVDEE